MKKKGWILLVGLVCLATIFVLGGRAHAVFYLDPEDQTLAVSGYFQTRETFRIEHSEGFTLPNTGAGTMVQQRNLFYLEINHDLKKVKFPWDFKVKYHALVRLYYDGIYDYGPDTWSLAERLQRRYPIQDINDFKQDYSLWEWYADISRGPFFLRLGRQNLSWGETDVFRLLDNINPLDNTFGFAFEDLNDRRIPLMMVRSSYNFGKVGPISSFAVEGFFVPGRWEKTTAPLSPVATPYAAPVPPPPQLPIPGSTFTLTTGKPEYSWDSSRFGLRLQGVLFDNVNLAIAGYRTYLDDPTPRMLVYQQFQPPFTPPNLAIELNQSENKVYIVGGSSNTYVKPIDTVIRTEAAYFFNAPVFIPAINTPAPDFSLGYPQFLTGDIPKRDFFRFAIGLDKDIWIRPLNKTNTFSFSLQYFGSYMRDWNSSIVNGIPKYPNSTDYVSTKRYEQTITLLARTWYLKGNLQPEITFGWDPRGSFLFIPAVTYQFMDRFRVKLQYADIYGKFVGFGFFRDRGQVSANFSVLF